MFGLLGVMNLGVSAAGLLLPVRGAHLRIHAAKSAELDWYLLIPLGSWAGGAFVERVIDALLE